MKIQVISDIHIDFSANGVKCIGDNFLDGEADVLVIAGDIAEYTWRKQNQDQLQNFFNKLYKKFKYIIEIPGNHDFYGTSYATNKPEFFNSFVEIEKDKHFKLNNHTIVLDGIEFICSTFWSYVSPENIFNIAQSMNDYRRIENFLINDMNELHAFSKEYVTNQIMNVNGNKKVVVTHHLPSYNFIDNSHKGNLLNAAYATNCDYLFDQDIAAWIYGHSHSHFNRMVNDTQVVSNCVGYVGHECVPFRNDMIIEV